MSQSSLPSVLTQQNGRPHNEDKMGLGTFRITNILVVIASGHALDCNIEPNAAVDKLMRDANSAMPPEYKVELAAERMSCSAVKKFWRDFIAKRDPTARLDYCCTNDFKCQDQPAAVVDTQVRAFSPSPLPEDMEISCAAILSSGGCKQFTSSAQTKAFCGKSCGYCSDNHTSELSEMRRGEIIECANRKFAQATVGGISERKKFQVYAHAYRNVFKHMHSYMYGHVYRDNSRPVDVRVLFIDSLTFTFDPPTKQTGKIKIGVQYMLGFRWSDDVLFDDHFNCDATWLPGLMQWKGRRLDQSEILKPNKGSVRIDAGPSLYCPDCKQNEFFMAYGVCGTHACRRTNECARVRACVHDCMRCAALRAAARCMHACLPYVRDNCHGP